MLRERSKIGTFVEVKNSDIGEGTKVPHLSYLGDADVGAGLEPRRRAASPPTTTGASKHRTTVGAGVRGSVHTSLRRAGDGRRRRLDGGRKSSSPRTSRPARSAVARERQRNVDGYDERRRREAEAEAADVDGARPYDSADAD